MFGWRRFLSLVILGFSAGSLNAADADFAKPLQVCLLSGCETYHSEKSLPPFQEFLDRNYNVECTRIVEYPGDGKPGSQRMLIYEQRLWSVNHPHNCDSGAEFYGTKGEMFLSRRGKVEVRSDAKTVVPVNIMLEQQNDAAHVANLCAAIRGQAELHADALTGHLSTSLCHLGNIATRLGRSLTFDPAREQIVGDEEANALVRREYREHWGTPKGV